VKKSLSLLATAALTLACLAVPLAARSTAQAAVQAPAQAQPVDMKKLIGEIVGQYEFAADTQTLLVEFVEFEGKLFGAPPGETPEEIHPVQGKPLCFDITLAQSGQYYELQFVRNDQGVIDKCIMNVGGMVIEGMKLKK